MQWILFYARGADKVQYYLRVVSLRLRIPRGLWRLSLWIYRRLECGK